MEFASLLSPMTVAEFVATAWNRISIPIPGHPDRFSGLAFDFDALRRALLTGLKRREDLKAQYFDAPGHHREMPIDPSQMDHCFAAGMTICITNLESYLPQLDAQARELRRSINFSGEMNFSCYWSPSDAGFGLHYDDHPVFIFQLEGEKRWSYSQQPALPEPRENFALTTTGLADLVARGLAVSVPQSDELEEVVLRPGDILYLPAGAWHKTSAVGGACRALTFRAYEGAPAHAIHHCLRTWMDQVGGWRLPLPIVAQADAQVPAIVEAVLAERLAELKAFVGDLTVTDIVRAWAELQSWTVGTKGKRREVMPGDRVALRKNIRVLRSRNAHGEACMYLYDGQSETEMALADNRWLEQFIDAGEFEASAACAWGHEPSTWLETKSLIEELIERGLAEVVGESTSG